MKSIKPGRGPSIIGGIGSLLVGLFGVIWTVMAANADGILALFGLIFIAVAVMMAIYHFKNATGKNRYSVYDITDADEEPDPLDRHFGTPKPADTDSNSEFCPYCGTAVKKDYEYCNKCGKRLP